MDGMVRPVVGIPMGDPAGIGPEIVLKALKNKKLYGICKPLVVGDAGILRQIGHIIGSEPKINQVSKPEEGKYV